MGLGRVMQGLRAVALTLGVGLAGELPLNALEANGAAAPYLHAGVGARAQGMGGAFVAVVDDVTASYWNPAGLTRMGVASTQLGAMYSFLTLDRSLNHFSIAHHAEGYGDFAVAFTQFSISDIEGFDRSGFSTGLVSDQEMALALSYANLVSYQFRYGFTLKGLHQDLFSARAFGYGVDVGMVYQPSLASDFMIAANVQDPVGSLNWESGRQDPLGANLKVGLCDRYMDQRFVVAADLDVPLGADGQLTTHLGAEIWLIEGLAARVGLDRRDMSAGGTWRYEFYEFDYAFMLNQRGLGDQHQISMILRF